MTTTTYETWTFAYDAEEQTWDVIDSDGDVVESLETATEASREVDAHNREAETEWLAEQIQERVEAAAAIGGQAGLDALRAMADFVGGIR